MAGAVNNVCHHGRHRLVGGVAARVQPVRLTPKEEGAMTTGSVNLIQNMHTVVPDQHHHRCHQHHHRYHHHPLNLCAQYIITRHFTSP